MATEDSLIPAQQFQNYLLKAGLGSTKQCEYGERDRDTKRKNWESRLESVISNPGLQ